MRRPEPARLELAGREIDALIVGTTQYDPRRLPAKRFQPMERYVAALGQLLRHYREPGAWIREGAFGLDWRALGINGPPVELDTLARLVELNLERTISEHRPYSFEYLDLDEVGQPTYDPNNLLFLSAFEIEELFRIDGQGDRIWAAHALEIERGFAAFFAEFLSAHIFLAPLWRIEAYGLRYDVGGEHLQDPSHLEAPKRTLRFGLIPRRANLDDAPPWSAAEFDREAMIAYLDERLAAGSIVLREVGNEGIVWPILILSPNQKQAVGARPTEAGTWRLAAPQPFSVASRRFVARNPERQLRAGAQLP